MWVLVQWLTGTIFATVTRNSLRCLRVGALVDQNRTASIRAPLTLGSGLSRVLCYLITGAVEGGRVDGGGAIGSGRFSPDNPTSCAVVEGSGTMDGSGRIVSIGRKALLGIFIVTPIRLYRESLAHFLQSSDGVAVVGTADESESTIRLVLELLPDVVLLDMALDDSKETARALRSALPGAPIVALAIPESEDRVVECAEAGVSAYVSRDASLEHLHSTVMSAAKGEAPCSPRIAAGLFRRVATLSAYGNVTQHSDQARLTAREREVLALVEEGLSNKQIARRLCIEIPTVKNHVHAILEKMGAQSRTEAAAKARRLRLDRTLWRYPDDAGARVASSIEGVRREVHPS